MLRASSLALIVGACLLAPVAFAGGPFTQRGAVSAIVDPATIEVHLVDGTSERVQIFGIVAPAAGSCAQGQATTDITALALAKSVWLVAVKGKPRRTIDAYAILPGGLDLGLELVKRGDATVRADPHPFEQRTAYLRAQAAAHAGSLGLWGCGTALPSKPGDHGHAHESPGKSAKH
jgi:endonuclease YncB( thermonuclease family)